MEPRELSHSIEITPRDQHFAFDDIEERDWLGGDAIKSLVFNALSITFPAGERFFIRSVRTFRDRIQQEKLKTQVAAFITQEALHTREHVRYNQRLEEHGCRARMLHNELQARFELAESKFSDLKLLAATCALEHFTAILADELLSNPSLLKDAKPAYRNVWLWHAMEETEHKGVAFDVFQEMTDERGYWLRVRTMITVTLLFLWRMRRQFSVLLEDMGYKKSIRARLRLSWLLWGNPGLFRKMMFRWAAYFKPGFHPWDRDNRALMYATEHSLALSPE